MHEDLQFWPGLCECGCGEATPIAKITRSERGQKKGEPLRFINGHNMRLPRSPEHVANAAAARRGKTGLPGALNPAWRGDAAGEDAIHKWLNAQYPKTGVCEECEQQASRTHYAYKHHPKPYTRNRDDYRELCTSCHKRFDGHTAEGGFHNAGWDKRRRNG
jgi:hypothetical protein